jgi:hypothetical protein
MTKFKFINRFLQHSKSHMVFKKNDKRKSRLSYTTVTMIMLLMYMCHNLVLVSNQDGSIFTMLQISSHEKISVIPESDITGTHHKTGSFVNCIPHHGDNTNMKQDQISFLSAKYGNDEPSSSSVSETYTGTIQVSCRPIQYIISLNQIIINKNNISIIVGVLSSNSKDGKMKRDSIRQTWANQESKRKMHRVFFLIAGSWDEIENEFNQHHDILWIDEEEVYNKEQSVLTLKTYSFIKIMDIILKEKKISYSHLFKTDDDSYVNLKALQREVDVNPNDYIGHCQQHEYKVIRDDSYKWQLTNQTYPEEYFPKYCQGAGYILSRNFVQCSSSLGHISQVRFMPFEDAAVGMLAERCGISPSQAMTSEIKISRYDSDEANRRVRMGDENKDGLVPIETCMTGKIVQHRVIDEIDMKELHKAVVNPKKYCKIYRRRRRKQIHYFESRGMKWYG